MKHIRITTALALLVLALLAVLVFAQPKQAGKEQMMDKRSAAGKKSAAGVMKEKAAHMKKGQYRCCLKHPCSFCAMMMGSCPCGENLRKGKPVCNECKGGWHAGDGAIPGIKATQVKTMPRGKM